MKNKCILTAFIMILLLAYLSACKNDPVQDPTPSNTIESLSPNTSEIPGESPSFENSLMSSSSTMPSHLQDTAASSTPPSQPQNTTAPSPSISAQPPGHITHAQLGQWFGKSTFDEINQVYKLKITDSPDGRGSLRATGQGLEFYFSTYFDTGDKVVLTYITGLVSLIMPEYINKRIDELNGYFERDFDDPNFPPDFYTNDKYGKYCIELYDPDDIMRADDIVHMEPR